MHHPWPFTSHVSSSSVHAQTAIAAQRNNAHLFIETHSRQGNAKLHCQPILTTRVSVPISRRNGNRAVFRLGVPMPAAYGTRARYRLRRYARAFPCKDPTSPSLARMAPLRRACCPWQTLRGTISQRRHYSLLGADTMSAPRDCTTGCRVNRVRRFVRKGGFGGKPGPRPAKTGGTHGLGVAGRRSPDARGFQGGVRANAPLDAVGNRVLGDSKVSAHGDGGGG